MLYFLIFLKPSRYLVDHAVTKKGKAHEMGGQKGRA